MCFWDVDRARLLAACEAHKSPVTSVDWNQLQGTLVLAASTSARVKLLDAKNLDYIMGVFVEHTKEVSQVRWNPNAADEFASVAADGLLKLWDRRVEESVGTLVDPEDGLEALVCCDWHKGQDWVLATGDASGRVNVWDTRNHLQPMSTRQAHRKRVSSVRFSTLQPSSLLSGCHGGVVRCWDTSRGIFLVQEHSLHTQGVVGVDWDLHNAERVVSVSADGEFLRLSLDHMVQVFEQEIRPGVLRTWKQPGLPPRRSHFPQEDTTLSTVPRHGSHHHLPSTTSVQEALSPDWWKGQAKL